MRHGKKALPQGIAKREKPFFFLRVIKIAIRRGKRVIKDRQRFVERNAVFALVALVFVFVPFKVDARRLLSQYRQLRRFFYYITKPADGKTRRRKSLCGGANPIASATTSSGAAASRQNRLSPPILPLTLL